MASPSKRVAKIFANIETSKSIATKPEVIVLSNGTEPHLDASFFYVSGFPYGLFEGSFLVARKDGTVELLTSPLEEEIARTNSNGIEIQAVQRDEMSSRLSELLRDNASAIGINSAELTVKSLDVIKSASKTAEQVDVSEAIESARLIKDKDEVECIQKACDIASDAYRKVPKILKKGTTESEVAARLAFEMQENGGSGVAFDSIIAFGKNSALPHYSAGDAKLKKGQFVLCDYGTKYRRYNSDITRTLVFGKASKQQKRMYEVVLEALEMGTQLCTPEYTGAEANSQVTEFIDSTEFKGKFIHSLGHSLGLSVHDGPGLSRNYSKKLEPGMVVTVEPGVYIPGVGGVRIEDDVLVTKTKPKILTSAKRGLLEA